MRVRLAVISVIAVSLGAVGLSSCTAPAKALSCTATATPTQPMQNTTAVVAVNTTPASVVVATAHYQTSLSVKTVVSNSLGQARVSYPVGPATVGYRVNIAVSVAKGSQKGACATSFVPRAAPPAPSTPDPAAGVLVRQCPELTFPGFSDDLAEHSYRIETTLPDCTLADAFATAAYSTGDGNNGAPITLDGVTCSVNLGHPTSEYICAGATGVTTFSFGAYPGRKLCPSPSPGTVGEVSVTGIDCAAADQIIAANGGAYYQAPVVNGLTCRPYDGYVPPGYTLYLVCRSPDESTVVGFLYKGSPSAGLP
jgi:hypothetical protein